MVSSATSVYIATSANRYSHCSSISPDGKGLVAFGAGRGIALWDSKNSKQELVHQILPGHTAEVVSVSFLPFANDKGDLAFVSGDAAGKVILWKRNGYKGQWTLSSPLPGHSASVTSICALSNVGWISSSGSSSSTAAMVLTASSDCKILVWIVELGAKDVDPKLLQTISTGGKIPLALAVSTFPGSDVPVLSLATTDRKIQIFTFQTESSEFAYSLSLEGHLDWVRALDFSPSPPPSSSTSTSSSSSSPDLLLASGSQDGYIRLWSLIPLAPEATKEDSPVASGSGGEVLDDEMMDEFERKIAKGGGEEEDSGEGAGGNGVGQVSMKAFTLGVRQRDGSTSNFSLSFSALLQGHDNWVTSLHFSPPSPSTSLQLLSSSADNSLIIWAPPPPSLLPTTSTSTTTSASATSSAIWYAQGRYGQVSVKGLGFFGALWGASLSAEGIEIKRDVLGSGWAGGWNVWKEGETEGEMWTDGKGPTGHFGGVRGVAWGGREGREWVGSVSSDETTRVHAPWTRPIKSEMVTTWAEIARPQIHGYPLTCLATLPPSQRFVSGADEKVVRVFEETTGFVDSLEGLGAAVHTSSGDEDEAEGSGTGRKRAIGASLPPLGLSNKMLMTEDPDDQDTSGDAGFNYTQFSISQAMTSPPTENTLSTSTYWPELEKLYGHGYELYALTSSHDSTLIATSCKSTNALHAVVRLYSTKTWKPLLNTLGGHSLTVTRIAFSMDDRFIVTVGRDRGWGVYERDVEGEGYHTLAFNPKPHARIIWDVSFSPLFPSPSSPSSFDDMVFATASRDKTVKIWLRPNLEESAMWAPVKILKFDEGVTSCDFYPALLDGRLVLAIGLGSGPIKIYTCSSPSTDASKWDLVLSLDSSVAHLEAVTRLAFQPPPKDGRAKGDAIRLASGSDDRSLRVFELRID
ncbi:WD40-repeat-containing domain protein [Mrakia frigida]|uniref:Elongator subunit ELP2 n=1 Tax=Mrakia frigida TaxID=29902 RepID=UPI003FCC0754